MVNSRILRTSFVLSLFLATSFVVSAQNQSGARQSTVHRHRRAPHRTMNVPASEGSKTLNSNLTKLETRTDRLVGAPHKAAGQPRAVPSKSLVPQDRQHNPAINFTYKASGTKGSPARGTGPRSSTPKLRLH